MRRDLSGGGLREHARMTRLRSVRASTHFVIPTPWRTSRQSACRLASINGTCTPSTGHRRQRHLPSMERCIDESSILHSTQCRSRSPSLIFSSGRRETMTISCRHSTSTGLDTHHGPGDSRLVACAHKVGVLVPGHRLRPSDRPGRRGDDDAPGRRHSTGQFEGAGQSPRPKGVRQPMRVRLLGMSSAPPTALTRSWPLDLRGATADNGVGRESGGVLPPEVSPTLSAFKSPHLLDAAGPDQYLPATVDDRATMMDALLLERAVYELGLHAPPPAERAGAAIGTGRPTRRRCLKFFVRLLDLMCNRWAVHLRRCAVGHVAESPACNVAGRMGNGDAPVSNCMAPSAMEGIEWSHGPGRNPYRAYTHVGERNDHHGARDRRHVGVVGPPGRDCRFPVEALVDDLGELQDGPARTRSMNGYRGRSGRNGDTFVQPSLVIARWGPPGTLLVARAAKPRWVMGFWSISAPLG